MSEQNVGYKLKEQVPYAYVHRILKNIVNEAYKMKSFRAISRRKFEKDWHEIVCYIVRIQYRKHSQRIHAGYLPRYD